MDSVKQVHSEQVRVDSVLLPQLDLEPQHNSNNNLDLHFSVVKHNRLHQLRLARHQQRLDSVPVLLRPDLDLVNNSNSRHNLKLVVCFYLDFYLNLLLHTLLLFRTFVRMVD